MARVPYLVSVLTAGIVLAASPLASATSNETRVSTAHEGPAMSTDGEMAEMAMCGERSQVIAELDQQYREKPMAVGQVDGNAVVEILVSESGTWTILATGTDGQSCIVSAGEGFESTTLVRGVDA
jgi:hypothetical protein